MMHRHDYKMRFHDNTNGDPFRWWFECECGDRVDTMEEALLRMQAQQPLSWLWRALGLT
jgi:hypothetical protein